MTVLVDQSDDDVHRLPADRVLNRRREPGVPVTEEHRHGAGDGIRLDDVRPSVLVEVTDGDAGRERGPRQEQTGLVS